MSSDYTPRGKARPVWSLYLKRERSAPLQVALQSCEPQLAVQPDMLSGGIEVSLLQKPPK
jgi:hypothetical protein